MGVVIVDGKEIPVGDADDGSMAFRSPSAAGIDIPRYCWHAGPDGRR